MRARRGAGAFLIDNFFRQSARIAKLHPLSRPERHGITVRHDVRYAPGGGREHLCDIYTPAGASAAKPAPIMLYVHGGGFRILSKDSHWIMGLMFARHGFVVVNINYRLAPTHRYPAALEDCAVAYRFVKENAAALGGDLDRFVLAGESAGANLVTSLAIAACYERPEPFARAVFETGLVPKVVLPACGIFQVSNPARLRERRKLPAWLYDRIEEVSSAYLPREGSADDGALADPLVVLERGDAPARPLPPFFLSCGTKDPLLDDTRRMKRALDGLGVKNDMRIYAGEPHAFHALVFRGSAMQHWRDTYGFLDEVMPSL